MATHDKQGYSELDNSYITEFLLISNISMSFSSNRSSKASVPYLSANNNSFVEIGTASNHVTFLSIKSREISFSHKKGEVNNTCSIMYDRQLCIYYIESTCR